MADKRSKWSKSERLFRFRKKYAGHFGVPVDDVELREYPDGDAVVWAPKYPELPEWSTGAAS